MIEEGQTVTLIDGSRGEVLAIERGTFANSNGEYTLLMVLIPGCLNPVIVPDWMTKEGIKTL